MLYFLEEKHTYGVRTPKEIDVTGVLFLLQTDLEEERDGKVRQLASSAYSPAHLQEHGQVSSWEDQIAVIFVSEWYIRLYKKVQFREVKKSICHW